VDTFLAVASLRAVRHYTRQPVDDQLIERILQAGRATGSSQNRQPWRFVLVTSRHRLDQLADAVYEPENLRECALAIAVVVPSSHQAFDAGRATQNMVLVAWDAGIASCPNGIKDRDLAARLLELQEGEHIAITLSFGYPKAELKVQDKTPEGLLSRINRKPLAELVTRL
jgi:nitroreductase